MIQNVESGRVEARKDFFRRNQSYIFGGFWIGAGIVSIFLKSESLPKYFYLLIGIVIVVYTYFHRDEQNIFIEWDRKQIKVKEFSRKLVVYKLEDIEDIKFSKKHMLIKSGKTKSLMVELRLYSPENIKYLKKTLSQLTKKDLQPQTA